MKTGLFDFQVKVKSGRRWAHRPHQRCGCVVMFHKVRSIVPIPQMRKQRIGRVKNLLKVRQLHENSGVISSNKLERFALTRPELAPTAWRRQDSRRWSRAQGSHTPCLRGMRCWGSPSERRTICLLLQQPWKTRLRHLVGLQYLLKEPTWSPPLSRRGGPLNTLAYSSQGFPVYSCQVTKDILRVLKK